MLLLLFDSRLSCTDSLSTAAALGWELQGSFCLWSYLCSLCCCCLLQGYGVYRFQDKYGANVDGYSPIYTPDLWTEGGDAYKLGTKGLIAWWVAAHRVWHGAAV